MKLLIKSVDQFKLFQHRNSKIKMAVIPTDEELMIARDCFRLTA